MPNKPTPHPHAALAHWAKRCYFAGRARMEDMLRLHDLGATQYYVLHHLVHSGPVIQGDLARTLGIERATLSVMVAALVRRGLVEQGADPADQRRKRLRLTPAGADLWARLPDLDSIRDTAFAGIPDADIAVAIRVLRTATERLDAPVASTPEGEEP